jgi:hypothetical protein
MSHCNLPPAALGRGVKGSVFLVAFAFAILALIIVMEALMVVREAIIGASWAAIAGANHAGAAAPPTPD